MRPTPTAQIRATRVQQLIIPIALWVLLASVYMLTYSGRIELGDEIQYFDAVGNVAAHGQMFQDISLWQPGSGPTDFSVNRAIALRIFDAEPGMMIAAVPLYTLAERVPNLGLVHTVYLFNVLVTPLVCVAFYFLALTLGYEVRIAVVVALCLGLLTALWPYSQTFFREPLMILWLVVGVMLLEKARRRVSALSTFAFILAALIAFALAAVSKEAVVLALPGLVIMALPDRIWQSALVRRLALPAVILIVVMTTLLAYTDLIQIMGGLFSDTSFFGRFALATDETQLILRIFAFSVGGSFWGTSPILLLSIPGAWLLWRKGQQRVVFGALLVALGYCVGYALFRGETWHGGTVWPQRFLLPALPFALLPALEVVSRVLNTQYSVSSKVPESDHDVTKESGFPTQPPALNTRHFPLPTVYRVLGTILLLYSAWWQFSGVSYRWEMYASATFQESFGLIHWLPGYFDLRFLRPLALTRFWGREELNFAWVRMDLIWWPLLFGGVAAVSGWVLWRGLFNGRGMTRPYKLKAGIFALPLVFLVFVAIALATIGPIDEIYLASRHDLFALVEDIRARTAPGDVVFISDPQSRMFYFNHGKFGATWTPILNYHPGERGSCDQTLEATSDNPAVLLSKGTIPLITHFAQNEGRERLWLVMESGPEVPCVVRPLERYLGQRYYRIGETRESPIARLIEFSTVSAPDPYASRNPEHLTDLRYTADNGEAVDLVGYTLPEGTTYHPDDLLPLSLAWRVDETPKRDFTVAWFVADKSGAVVAQGEDTWPGATFAPATLMTPGVLAWDHRALWLPSDLPAGEYQVWVRMYWYNPETGSPDNLIVSGGQTAGEDTIGVLDTTIQVMTETSK